MFSQFAHRRRAIGAATTALTLLLSASLLGGCEAAKNTLAAQELQQPFTAQDEDAIVLVSAEVSALNKALFRLTFTKKNESFGYTHYEVSYVHPGDFMFRPLGMTTSYGYLNSADSRYYFLIRMKPGTYYLSSNNFEIGDELFKYKDNGKEVIESLKFTAVRGRANYAGNLVIAENPRRTAFWHVIRLSQEEAQARQVLAAQFPQVQADFRNAMLPDSRIARRTVREVRYGPGVIFLPK